MINIVKFILAILAFTHMQSASAQSLLDLSLNADFAAQVKSIDEFICRFNGIELNPEIKNDSGIRRRNNIIALFDFQMSHTKLSDNEFKQLITGFVNRAIESGIRLQITNSKMWAEAKSSIKVDGKKKVVTLVLKSETYKKNFVRWAIVGVKGLVEADIIDTTNYYAISPVEHEIHFMTLDNIFRNNRAKIMGYRGKDATIDELSVFLTLAMTGKIDFCMVDKLTIHCLEVPGYAFTINELGRRGNNSGWLISKLIPLEDYDKKQYIKKLLNR